MVPAKKANGIEDKKGNANLNERWPALAKLTSAIPATTIFSTSEMGGTRARLIPARTSIAI